jgi:hypothetical protein
MLPIVLALAAAEPPAAVQGTDAPSPALQSLLQNCDAHKFETMIEVPGPDGTVKHSRMKLCGTTGQTDADWLRTLRDAVAKTEANEKMPPAIRQQIVTAVNAEISRLQGQIAPPKAAALPPPRTTVKTLPSEDYAALPPLPDTPPPPVHVLPGASAALPVLPRPRLSFDCFTPGDAGGGPCTDFTRDTMLTVRADEDLPAGTSLRFVRNGKDPADVELAQLKRGRSMRVALPGEVCRGFTNGSLEIRIVRAVPAAGPAGVEVGQEGPYALRC